ncbi:hypothetical protein U472_08255 [Orenia metallireducens]|uniref:Uncharacterized protein n=1 Tax=Orenia metallireducens TaxID=1413210 RepID=A0A1C0A6Y1_9FIRM|nr:hypothetical protein [Orenia metallireducens]OCL26009.1 hypothetical protein U472_08255 [Orenia metallireducens]
MKKIYEKHEPASINKGNFGFVKIKDENNWGFINPPDDIRLLNRYIIEKTNIGDFIKVSNDNYFIYSCILANRSDKLTKIQRMFKENKLKKNGWVECNQVKELYIKNISNLNEIELELMFDRHSRSMLILAEEKKSIEELIEILREIDLFIQPRTVGSYYPTLKFIPTLVSENVSVGYFRRLLEPLRARDVLILYSPWKL